MPRPFAAPLAALSLLACHGAPAATPPPRTVASAAIAPSAPTAPKPPTRVAITFDDLPAHGPLPAGESRLDVVTRLVATLAAHHVPPTWGFVNGGKLREHPEDTDVVRAWVRAGHLLGNHGLSHLHLDDDADVEAYLRDVDADEETLRVLSPAGTAERSWKVFRYPFLQEGTTPAMHARVRQHLRDRGYRVAEVSIDFGDWAWNAPYARCSAHADTAAIDALDRSYVGTAKVFLRWSTAAARQALGRDVPQVLMLHVGAHDARALDALLTAYEQAGVVFVGLDEALDDPAYAIDTRYYGRWGEGFFEQLADGVATVTLPMPEMPLTLLDGLCRGG
jgi:peptidoglycan/xylan/chitin deacetylase (PgdA/CDA1 family)